MAQPIAITKPVSNIASLAARLSIVSGVLFVLLLASLHVLEPEFDPTWRFLSEYALGNFGWMMHLAFFTLATSLASAGVALISQVRGVVGYIGLGLLFIGAIGLLLAGVFRTDPMTTSEAAMTWSGKLHGFAAAFDWTPVAALLLSFSLVRHQSWRPVRLQLFVTAGISLVVMITFTLL